MWNISLHGTASASSPQVTPYFIAISFPISSLGSGRGPQKRPDFPAQETFQSFLSSLQFLSLKSIFFWYPLLFWFQRKHPSYSSYESFSVSFPGASSLTYFLHEGTQLATPSQPHTAHKYVLFDIFSILKEFEFIRDIPKWVTSPKKDFRHFLID